MVCLRIILSKDFNTFDNYIIVIILECNLLSIMQISMIFIHFAIIFHDMHINS